MSDDHRNPSEVDPRRSWFDEFAARAHDLVSRDAFFIVLAVLTLMWLPSYFLFHSVDHWYVAFVLPAEVITLFLVALLENSNRRSEQALHRKLDAFAVALAAMANESQSAEVRKQAHELLAAVGLQDRESTDD
ncbi:low affinity iron permease family protein [Nocardia salmonicida]|uniref:low affinity iron permease family protein n=1 Tax=Nocardia salmonicida TaxID=53431 RepID=UPI0033FCBD04